MAVFKNHPNGYVRLSEAHARIPWNADSCICGALKDKRAIKCRGCYSTRPEIKFCSGCTKTLPISHFYARSDGGFVTRCKGCVAAEGAARDRETQRRYDVASRSRPGHYVRVAARIKERLATDTNFRLGERLRQSLRDALKRDRVPKNSHTLDLLGCSIAELRVHLERQWRPGMSWANWGLTRACWQIDHRRPIASFDLSDPAQLAACFHFTNLQPLWASENAAKGARWDGVQP